jgi:restriction endonuclease S subunit
MKSIRANNKLGEVALISAGHPIRGSLEALPLGSVRIVQMRDIDSEHTVDWSSVAQVVLPTKKEPDWLCEGDILLSTRGYNNLAALIQGVPKQAVCAPSFFLIRVQRSEIIPAFLCWQLNQRPAQTFFHRGATGSHILNLRKSVVENLPVALPPLAEQQSIVNFFTQAQQEQKLLKRLLKNREDQLEAIARDLMKTQG